MERRSFQSVLISPCLSGSVIRVDNLHVGPLDFEFSSRCQLGFVMWSVNSRPIDHDIWIGFRIPSLAFPAKRWTVADVRRRRLHVLSASGGCLQSIVRDMTPLVDSV